MKTTLKLTRCPTRLSLTLGKTDRLETLMVQPLPLLKDPQGRLWKL